MLDEEIDYGDFYKIIDFIRNYTDGHHHAKEEDILFKAMGEKAPKLVDNGPITGMLIEHDMASCMYPIWRRQWKNEEGMMSLD